MSEHTPRCHGCAFTPGTEANRSDITRIKATLCVRLCEPFMCHDGVPEGGEPDALCRGWGEAQATLYQAGYYRRMPEWRRQVLRGCLATIVQLEDSIIDGQPVPEDAVPALLWAAIQREHALGPLDDS